MSERDPKSDLRDYLQEGREALLWKLDGLSEFDIRRPMAPTGTNLLGLIKHVASLELRYLGDIFERPSGEPLPWLAADAEPNADMWATADESREQIVGLDHRAWAHADATIEALTLDAIGHIPWWRRSGAAQPAQRPLGPERRHMERRTTVCPRGGRLAEAR